MLIDALFLEDQVERPNAVTERIQVKEPGATQIDKQCSLQSIH